MCLLRLAGDRQGSVNQFCSLLPWDEVLSSGFRVGLTEEGSRGVAGACGAPGQSCVPVCELTVSSVSM